MSSLCVTRIPIETIVPDAANARVHPEANLDTIAASLKRFGQVEPLVIQKKTRRLVAGHGRLLAMKALGWTECDVVELDVTSLDATALAIALNRSAELAEWDDRTLAKLLNELRIENSLDGVGYCPEDIDRMLDEIRDQDLGEYEEDIPPEPLDQAVTKRGDLWLLGGSNRLLCADSAKREDLERLLNGARIQLVNSDPPYNVKVEPRSNNAIAAGISSFTSTQHQSFDSNPGKANSPTRKMRAKDRPLMNDFVTEEEFDRLLNAWFGNLAFAMEPGAVFYIWGGYANLGNYPGALRANGLYFSQAVVWNKLHPVLTRKDFMGAHEWCFYGWREGAGHNFYGPNNATDLWEVKKVTPQLMVHLTEKPVELAIRAIEYSSRRGENVLDLFGGSGSTLMGCEHTGRRGYLMELDEHYADVIVRRFQAKTGKVARLSESGKSFEEVAKERGVDDVEES